MRAGFRPDQAASEEESRIQSSAGQARGEEDRGKGQQAKQEVKKKIEVGQEDLQKKVDDLKKKVETGQENLKKKVDEVQTKLDDVQTKLDELLKKVDAQKQQKQQNQKK
jgi:type I site-specific restriction endonuclease